MMTWPNRLTVLRILLLTPFMILVLSARDMAWLRYAALGVFGLMALCDLLDGQLARRLQQQTRLGAILDPLADKLVLTASLVVLTYPGWREGVDNGNPFYIPLWATITILSKDFIVLLGVTVMHFLIGRVDLVRVSVPGKLATATSFVLVLLVLLAPDVNRLVDDARMLGWIVRGAAAVPAVLAAVTGLDYIRRGSAAIAHQSGEERI